MSYSDYLEGLRDGARIGFTAGFKAGWEVGQENGYLSGYHDGYCDRLNGLYYKPVDRYLEHKNFCPDPPKINVKASLFNPTPKLPDYTLPKCEPIRPKCEPPMLKVRVDPLPPKLGLLPKRRSYLDPWEL